MSFKFIFKDKEQQPMKCQNCNKICPANTKFCSDCGASLINGKFN